MAPARRRLTNAYVLRADFESLMVDWKEKNLSKNKHALDAWIDEREEMVERRHEVSWATRSK